ncbi:hypothetical protein [Stenotrophomonas rhizophila]|uniref:hypothetical protein n=1 Tax=Stenotrophomonas rhizophila TaxID=216778 RepID=UPI0028B14F46|nr:hypothetical protein [Stenotrophomonas rhizophila]
MNLTDYATSKGGTAKLGCPILASTATAAKCSAATLYMIARGHKQVSARLAVRIATATGNKVTTSDLRPDLFGVAATTGFVPVADAVLVAPITKRALREKLGLGNDGHLAKLLKLPVAQVQAWPEEQDVPALSQVLQLLGVREEPGAAPALQDPDAGRIVTVEAA